MPEVVEVRCRCGSLMAMLRPGSGTKETCKKCGDTISAPIHPDDDDDFIEMIGC